MIRDEVTSNYPYSYYFHSGFLGSGVCVFSKGPIVDTLMHRYSLNGFAHHIHRGDWFGGKTVGLAKIIYKGFRINLYSTHIHAEYNKHDDLYTPHRVVQAYELSQFINNTGEACDLIILTGDLNVEPDTLGYKIVTHNTKLMDAWRTKATLTPSGETGNTCDVPESAYVTQQQLDAAPLGSRIDYIMYRKQTIGMVVICTDCSPCMGRVPTHTQLTYSDHLGVEAKFTVKMSEGSGEKLPIRLSSVTGQSVIALLKEVNNHIVVGRDRIKCDRRNFMAGILVTLAAFIYTIPVEYKYMDSTLVFSSIRTIQTVMTLFMGWMFLHGVVGLKIEEKAYKAAEESIKVKVRCSELNGFID